MQVTATAEDVRAAAHAARAAARQLAVTTSGAKDAALLAMAAELTARASAILAANAADLQAARSSGVSGALLDRLALTDDRLLAMANGLRQVAALPDPIGEVVRGFVQRDGLDIRQVRVPLGVVGIIYEARPNVTADAAGLCVKSGNSVLLRGSSLARHSNEAIVDALRAAATRVGIPADAVQLAPGTDRDSVKHLLRARGLVDVVIPRGGADLIRRVVDEATVPVIETGVGNCHVYVDAAADLDVATAIVLNAKTQRPGVCNAAETLLVHRAVAPQWLPTILQALADAGVTVHGDDAVAAAGSGVVPANDDDWAREYLSLDMAARVVDSLDEAVDHIDRWGTGHTEAIVTRDQTAARRFTAHVDAAAVMVNASTRFTDGEQFGFGGEIGISTQKLHARGPMGLRELTTTKYVVSGDGQVRT